jgi:hypothetical protein
VDYSKNRNRVSGTSPGVFVFYGIVVCCTWSYSLLLISGLVVLNLMIA